MTNIEIQVVEPPQKSVHGHGPTVAGTKAPRPDGRRLETLSVWDILPLLVSIFLVSLLVAVALRSATRAHAQRHVPGSELQQRLEEFEQGMHSRRELIEEGGNLMCSKKVALYTHGPPRHALVTSTVLKPDASGYPKPTETQTIDCWLPGNSKDDAGSRGQDSSGEVHVQYTADVGEYAGMLASLHSALKNSAEPGRLRFHLTIPSWADERELCLRLLGGLERAAPQYICPADTVRHYAPAQKKVRDCAAELPPTHSSSSSGIAEDTLSLVQYASNSGSSNSGGSSSPSNVEDSLESSTPAGGVDAAAVAAAALEDSCYCGSAQFHIIKYNAELYEIPPVGSTHGADAARMTLSSARAHADQLLLPMGVQRVIHLEPDTIVQGDLVDLWVQPLNDGQVAAAVLSCSPRWLQLFKLGTSTGCDVSTAVYVLDLKAYQRMVHMENDRFIATDAGHAQQRPVFHFEDEYVQQPALVRALSRQAAMLNGQWHAGGLGERSMDQLSSCTLKSSLLLHWSGPNKPWSCPEPGTCYDSYWQPYNLE